MKAGYHKEESEKELDIKADVDALVGDSDLSEEFKQATRQSLKLD